jgi:hypothetical protein
MAVLITAIHVFISRTASKARVTGTTPVMTRKSDLVRDPMADTVVPHVYKIRTGQPWARLAEPHLCSVEDVDARHEAMAVASPKRSHWSSLRIAWLSWFATARA